VAGVAENTARRGYRLWEEEMLAEYCATFHRDALVMSRVRLGELPGARPDMTLTEEERRLVGAVWRRWADAVVIERDRLLVVETGLVPDPGDISQVQTYLRLVGATPELAAYHALPRRGLLVWAVDDPYCREVAVAAGLEVRIYRPSHFREWIETKRGRERRAPVARVP
jgi:hypothetical protein